MSLGDEFAWCEKFILSLEMRFDLFLSYRPDRHAVLPLGESLTLGPSWTTSPQR